MRQLRLTSLVVLFKTHKLGIMQHCGCLVGLANHALPRFSCGANTSKVVCMSEQLVNHDRSAKVSCDRMLRVLQQADDAAQAAEPESVKPHKAVRKSEAHQRLKQTNKQRCSLAGELHTACTGSHQSQGLLPVSVLCTSLEVLHHDTHTHRCVDVQHIRSM